MTIPMKGDQMRMRDSLITLISSAALVLSVGLYGCNGDNQGTSDSNEFEQVEQVDESTANDESTNTIPDASEIVSKQFHIESQADESTGNETLATTEDAIVSEINGDQAEMTDTQRNSMAMLNYLTVVTEDINSSKNSRLKLEETYSTLINNTYPNAVDDRTLAQLESLLDTIEGYRMVDVKRERLEFIFEQNQAQAIRSAIPNPLGLLSAVQSGNLAQLASSVVYMAIDSYTSYQSATASADLEYLKGGWELDDEEASVLHERRKDTFAYMVRTVTDYDLPGYLALNEGSVKQLVEWSNNSNIVRRIRFLESNQDTYKAYGGYWLTLASSYYQNGDYQKCLSALSTYESLRSGILRKDYDYAKTIPLAIVAASETMSDAEYSAFAEKHVAEMVQNCDNTDWELLYFAAQTYVDLYGRTGNEAFLLRAYNLALDNVNFLVEKQNTLNRSYLSSVVKAKEPAGATKQQKSDVKQYNKMLEETRKTALPPVYQPLLVNCDLLFALADKLEVSDADRAQIDGILHPGGDAIFLTQAIDEKYRFSTADDNKTTVGAEFDGKKLTISGGLVSEATLIEATTESGETLLGEWKVTKVDRRGSNDVDDFVVTIENKSVGKSSYKDGEVVTITFTDGEGDSAITRTLVFKASVEEKWGPLPNNIEFELVKK